MNNNECYIDYLDCKNNFKETRKSFSNYDAAYKWLSSNMEKWSIDMIHFYY